MLVPEKPSQEDRKINSEAQELVLGSGLTFDALSMVHHVQTELEEELYASTSAVFLTIMPYTQGTASYHDTKQAETGWPYYVVLLESIFDFPLIKSFLSSHTNDFRVLFDGLHGVTGPYAHALFVDVLGLPKSSVQNCVPLPDFGGGHPDPNLTYAHSLVEAVEKNGIEFGAATGT
ncbi:hypothetical protein DFH06DRAFT_1394899 [Mycena polygramma]|nr:hypothetical protein DFH06DRAFT_1394899 [Mycena polygramma]